MNKIDFILAIPLLWGAFIGFKKGFVLELASLVALILGVFGALKFSDYTAQKLTQYVDISSNYLGLISFLVTFMLIVFAVFLFAKMLDKALKLVALGLVNRLLGLVFGLFKYALILSFLLYFFENINRKLELVSPEYKKDSLLFEPIQLASKPFSQLLDSFEIPEFDLEDKAEDLKESGN